jgi:hypothetical protein
MDTSKIDSELNRLMRLIDVVGGNIRTRLRSINDRLQVGVSDVKSAINSEGDLLYQPINRISLLEKHLDSRLDVVESYLNQIKTCVRESPGAVRSGGSFDPSSSGFSNQANTFRPHCSGNDWATSRR